VPTWRSDRIVLIGDAAHPVGAGASMAIEDALAVATALQAEPTVAAALTAYDTARRPRIVKAP
jgi:salicylate hydroxylase